MDALTHEWLSGLWNLVPPNWMARISLAFVLFQFIALAVLFVYAFAKVTARYWLAQWEKRTEERLTRQTIEAVVEFIQTRRPADPPRVRFFERGTLKRVLVRQIAQLKGAEKNLLANVYRAQGFLTEDLRDLRSRRWHKRLGAAITLNRLDLAEGTEQLKALCDDPVPVVNLAALRTLSKSLPRHEAFEILRRMEPRLSGRWDVLTEALLSLGENDPGFILAYARECRREELIQCCLTAMGTLRVAEAVPQILELLSPSSALLTQIHAVEALGRIGDPRVTPRLYPLLSHPSSKVRAATLTSLIRLGEKLPWKSLYKISQDPAIEVKRAARSIPGRKAA